LKGVETLKKNFNSKNHVKQINNNQNNENQIW
jgi:hypothetical protein